jgi:hypothetical protein
LFAFRRARLIMLPASYTTTELSEEEKLKFALALVVVKSKLKHLQVTKPLHPAKLSSSTIGEKLTETLYHAYTIRRACELDSKQQRYFTKN